MKKWKKLLIIFVSAALLVGAVLVLKPRYDAFIDQDNIETCYDAMYWTGIWYHMAIRDEKRAGSIMQHRLTIIWNRTISAAEAVMFRW